MFVRRIPYQSVRRRKIQHWLLLLVRVAALALIIFAFARPFIRQSNLPVGSRPGARELGGAARHQLQHGLCRSLGAGAFGGAGADQPMSGSDRGSVVLFSSGAGHRGSRLDGPFATLRGDCVGEAGAGATRYAPALKVAGGILSESTLRAARWC
jgi:hypothetical protein